MSATGVKATVAHDGPCWLGQGEGCTKNARRLPRTAVDGTHDSWPGTALHNDLLSIVVPLARNRSTASLPAFLNRALPQALSNPTDGSESSENREWSDKVF